MRLILVLIFLPFIYLFGLIASPVLQILGRTMFFVESLRAHFGPWAEYVYLVAVIWMVVYCFKSSKFFWFLLLPFLCLSALVGRW